MEFTRGVHCEPAMLSRSQCRQLEEAGFEALDVRCYADNWRAVSLDPRLSVVTKKPSDVA